MAPWTNLITGAVGVVGIGGALLAAWMTNRSQRIWPRRLGLIALADQPYSVRPAQPRRLAPRQGRRLHGATANS
jgi:hypothetical protein